MGMLNSLNPVFKFSHITQASYSEFVIDGHYYTSPNQQEYPPTVSISHSEPLPSDASPTQLRGRVWALDHFSYLPFVLFSPFHGTMTSRLATPVEVIPLVDDSLGYHLPKEVAKSWKRLEDTCLKVTILCTSFREDHPQTYLGCSVPPNPSKRKSQ